MIDEITTYLSEIKVIKRPKTYQSYRDVLHRFVEVVGEDAPITPDTYKKFLLEVQSKRVDRNDKPLPLSLATRALYGTVVLGFYEWYGAEHPEANLAKIHKHKKTYVAKVPRAEIHFEQADIHKVIEFAMAQTKEIRDLRNRALIVTLADTGLRIHEACTLLVGHINWQEYTAYIEGKGGVKASVRFSNRSIDAVRDYLEKRFAMDSEMETKYKIKRAELPLFGRHDNRGKNKTLPITTSGAFQAIKNVMSAAGVLPNNIRIHDFRHYFVSVFYQGSGGRLYETKEVARHGDISTTSRYTHTGDSVDKLYDKVFNEGDK